MNIHSYSSATQLIIDEIIGQPKALQDLTSFYLSTDGEKLLNTVNAGEGLAFTGMGASFQAACFAAESCILHGHSASAIETSSLCTWPEKRLKEIPFLVCISQSGESGEVVALIQKLKRDQLTAITNDPDSTLAKHARICLPLLAGEETLIASKTYVNSLALAWLLCRRVCGVENGGEADQMKQLRRRVQVMLEGKEAIFQSWQDCLGDVEEIFFLGNGLQAISARQTSLMLAEWAKLSAPAFTFGSFRHGFAELLNEKSNVVAFIHPDNLSTRDEEFLHWVKQTGARVTSVVEGFPQRFGVPARPLSTIEKTLSPILDTVSGQLLAVSLAENRKTSGFRYLSKIVR